MECPNGSYLPQFLHKYVHMFSCPAILSSCTFLLNRSIQKNVIKTEYRNKSIQNWFITSILLCNHIKLQWNVRMVPILHSSSINMYTCSRVLEFCLLAHFYMVTFECGYNMMYTCPRLMEYCLLAFFLFLYFSVQRMWTHVRFCFVFCLSWCSYDPAMCCAISFD